MLQITLFLSSCNSTYYIPEEVNGLQLKEKGDLNIAFSNNPYPYNSGDLSYPINFQVGYSPINNLGFFCKYGKV